MITRQGSGFAGRVAASLLNTIDRTDCIAPDAASYEAMALRLAREPTRLAELRNAVQKARGSAPLFDTRRYTRHFEQALVRMHSRNQAGLPPEAFDVPSVDNLATQTGETRESP
jgi:predicted O-linked N-acetylglucosamine transferase (SPINDLY family)